MVAGRRPHPFFRCGEHHRSGVLLVGGRPVSLSLPFDGDAARAYGRIFATVVAAGRKARGPRAIDLLIAAAALAANLPLYTRNGADFRAIEELVDVVIV